MFELHEEVPSLAAAIACPLNKPRKPKVVGNLRAIQFLNESRKIFSSIFLSRARDVFSQVLGASHFGFLRCRDKSELLWSYQWISERAAKLKLRLSVLGLDLSRAFDTPRRAKLLSLLEGVLDPDCCRMARVLLSKSNVSVRVGRYVGVPFETNLAVPQGDCASPLLFLFYEHFALRACLAKWHLAHPAAAHILEWAFADDVDLHHRLSDEELGELLALLKDELWSNWGLSLNLAKTERFVLSKVRKDRLGVKKLGAMLDRQQHVAYVREKAAGAFKAVWPLWWRRNNLPLVVKMRLYNALILPPSLPRGGGVSPHQS
jgi:hypothetical protein